VDLLRTSAIPLDLAERVGVRSICAADAEDAGFGGVAGHGLLFPYREPKSGAAIEGFSRLRLDRPKGRVRYIQPPWSRNRLYIPIATPDELSDPALVVIVTEGERKALAVIAWCERRKLRYIVIGIGGVWSWRHAVRGQLPEGGVGKVGSIPIEDLEAITWTGRNVIIVFDSDVLTNPEVRRAERALAQDLASRGALVRTARIPAGPNHAKLGADDFLATKGDDEMGAIFEAARPANTPEIIIGPDMPRVVDEGESALHAVGGIYSRGRALVEVSKEHARHYAWLARSGGAPSLAPLGEPRLRELLADAAQWKTLKPGESKLTMPPPWVPRTLLDRPSWTFPEITMVSETPLLRPDGTVINAPGYDGATGVLFETADVAYPRVPDQPGREDAQACAETLIEPLSDFPFAAPSDRAAVLAAILTLVARPAFRGPAPLFAIDAHVQGSGKTLLADVVGIVGTGRVPPKMPAPKDEAEVGKRVLAVAIEALRLVLLDNVTGTLRSAVLSAALTATEWRDRLLGRNVTATAPLTTVWMMTSNNATFDSDFARRIVPIHLDPICENPEERTGFKYPDLRAHVQAKAPSLVAAALTMLRAFHVAGRPSHKQPLMGSFEGWDNLVRGTLLWIGQADPLAGRKRVRAESDVELEALREALAEWAAAFDVAAVTASAAVEKAGNFPDLAAALSGLARCPVAKLDATRLGYALRRVAGRIVGGVVLQREDGQTHGAARWKVRTVTSDGGGHGGHGGHVPNPSREDARIDG
jgi:hypothetical protein